MDEWLSNRDQPHGGEQALEGGPQVPELEDEIRADSDGTGTDRGVLRRLMGQRGGSQSQAGYMVFITGNKVYTPEGDVANLVEWRSHRIRRRCRSTLAAETMALDAAADAALFTRELLAELLIEGFSNFHGNGLPLPL